MAKTGIVRDDRFLDHRPGPGHPESHLRLEAIYSMLDETGMSDRVLPIHPRKAKPEELLRVHASTYVERIASTQGGHLTPLDPDTAVSEGSYEAALFAVGGLCQAVDMVHSGELNNAFALVRPPGHHAEKDRAMGFCLFNNVAVGARYAQQAYGMHKILIVDWDLHHGNGTQHTFENDPGVLYFSTHQYPYYPGSGAYRQIGRDEGEGFTVNVPLAAGHGDGEYVQIYERILAPVALEFQPELVLVSAGFDIYEHDPLGGMRVTPRGFAKLAQIIMGIAATSCDGRLVMTLEGGYNLRGLQESVRAVLLELAGSHDAELADWRPPVDQRKVDQALRETSKVHGRFWKHIQ
jgi:acetoin utilization deacetylase AcuC-like enzyme